MQSTPGHASPHPPRRSARRVAVRVLWSALAVLLAAYMGISTAAAWILTTPVRQPATTTPSQAGLAYQDVRFPARGGDVQIAGWYAPSPGSSRAVVLVHGKDSSRAAELGGHFVDLAAGLHRRGLAVLLIDLRGHGDSGDGRFGFGLVERRDVIGAVDWLEAQGFPAGRIGVLGVSLGAAAAIGAAHDDADIGALVSDCSYADVFPLMQMHWHEASGLPDFFLPPTLLAGRLLLGRDLSQSRPVDEIGALGGRAVLIIHGTADRFTPVAHGRELAAADARAQYWEVPGAGHAEAYAANPAAYVDRVGGFFDQALPATR